ncbi:MAG: hypothetical protein LKI53_05170 [Bacteroidales bacterium]|jgi:dihydrofolate synthase/folylpolyglutamate synthase|nr:hypothetical protein [Bacteroidales bacterium]
MKFTPEEYDRELEIIFNRFPSFQKVGGRAFKPGIETMLRLDEFFGHPAECFRSIHIAGTNGKGSVAHFLAAALSGAGYKTGLYTSPHMIDFRERIKINGDINGRSLDNNCRSASGAVNFSMIPREDVYRFLTENKPVFEKFDASFFDITTIMAFRYFADTKVDYAVVECGLGGRLDSTNIITPQLSVITSIGLDHCQYLGNTLPEIAFEKAGIIKPGVPVVIGENSGVGEVFEKKASECGSSIYFADGYSGFESISDMNDIPLYDELPEPIKSINDEDLDLRGYCQDKNLRTAKVALDVLMSCVSSGKAGDALPEALGEDRGLHSCLSDEKVYSRMAYGIKHAAKITGLHGRWEKLHSHPDVYCDMGHNAHAFKIVSRHLSDTMLLKHPDGSFLYNRLVFFYGVMADKDLAGISGLLPGNKKRDRFPQSVYYYFVNPDGTRAIPAADLSKKMLEYGFEGEACHFDNMEGKSNIKFSISKYFARDMRRDDFVFIGGSAYVVAEALEIFLKKN